MLRSIGSVTFLALLMVGCGGGHSASPPPATYTVGGAVTGLSSSGLVLTSNFSGEDLAISASGTFTFSTRLPVGSTYNVGVKSQPTAQGCQVANGTGTVAAANVTTVDVTCMTGYTVGGTVSGLVGSGLELAICKFSGDPYGKGHYICGSPLPVSANGTFTLTSATQPTFSFLPDRVEVTQQPSSPTQRCLVGNASINIQYVNDTVVTVSCAAYSYVINAADNTLSSYRVDATTGAVAVIGAPKATGVSPYAIVGTQFVNQQYVFVGNEGSNDVSAFAVNSKTGVLSAVPGSPFAAGTDPKAMALYGSDSLYVANAGSDNITAYSIDADTGALAEAFTIVTGKSPTSVVFVPDTSFLYVANHGGSNDISAYSQDYGWIPVPGSPFPAGGNPLSLALGAGGKFLYSANPDATNPSISGFSIDPNSGALAPLSGSPFPLSVSNYLATDQTGAYLYVTSGANVVGYGIDANTGALTALAGFPVTVGADAYSITIDPTNRFLYVAAADAAHVSGFTLDASTGTLIPMSGSPFPAGNRPEFLATF